MRSFLGDSLLLPGEPGTGAAALTDGVVGLGFYVSLSLMARRARHRAVRSGMWQRDCGLMVRSPLSPPESLNRGSPALARRWQDLKRTG